MKHERMMEEPRIKVGVLQGCAEVNGRFNGAFRINNKCRFDGDFSARIEGDHIVLADSMGHTLVRQQKIQCTPLHESTFTLFDVTIGIHFHWERKQEQTFRGNLTLMPDSGKNLVAVNEIPLEDYLSSVISSEMSSDAPLEFLKSHAITSRSWLMAMLNRTHKARIADTMHPGPIPESDELIRWYDGIDHTLFDVCGDDHCQRYQGISRLNSENAQNAVHATRGLFLFHNNEVCDARYHKACGGLTDNFENIWENTPIPYLTSVSDSSTPYDPICTEEDAKRWIFSNPEAYCNTTDGNIMRQILPSFDQETTDIFRWKVVYVREELEDIIRKKSGIDCGDLQRLIPIERGPSGRIIRLKIEGSKKTVTIGKELEIRRWLSRSHLYSSAFVVSFTRDSAGRITHILLHGAGWGHGVGLCQIGAAVMALKGFTAESILNHYFRNAELKKLY